MNLVINYFNRAKYVNIIWNIKYFDLQWLCSSDCREPQETTGSESNQNPDDPLPSAPITSVEMCILDIDLVPNYHTVILSDPLESPTLVDETCPPPSYAEYLQNNNLIRWQFQISVAFNVYKRNKNHQLYFIQFDS